MGQRHSKVEGKEEKVEVADAHASAPKLDQERTVKAGSKAESELLLQPEPGPDSDAEKPTTTMTPTQAQPPVHPHPPVQSNPTNATAPGAPETDPAKDAPTRETAASSPQLPAPSQASPYVVPCSSADNKGCPAGEYCTSQNVCTPMLANGMACSSNVECASSACQAAVCVAAASAPAQSSSLNLPLVLSVVGGLLFLIALLYVFCKWYERRARKRGAVDGLRRDPAEAARAALGKPAGSGSTPFGCAAVPIASRPTASLSMAQLNDPAVRQAQLLQQQGLFYVDRSGTQSIWNYPHGPFPRPSMSSAYSTFPVDDRQAAAFAACEARIRSSATDLPISTRAYDHERYTDGSYAVDPSPAIIGRLDPRYTADVSQSARTLPVPDSRAVLGPLYSVKDSGEVSHAEYARHQATAAAATSPCGSRPVSRENLSSGSIGTLPEGEFYPTITPKGLAVVNASKDDFEVSVISAPKSPGSVLVSSARSTPRNENDAFAGREATLTLANFSGEPQFGTMPLLTSEASHRPARGQESDVKPSARPSLTSEASYQAPQGENVAQATFLDPSTPLPLPSFPTYDDRYSANGRLKSEQNAHGGYSSGSETLWR